MCVCKLISYSGFPCSILSKPLPRATHKTPGVNDLDFKIGDTREMELVRLFNAQTCQ